MNEKQILKEIAYYSKLINNHKKSLEKPPKPLNNHFFKKPINNYVSNNVKTQNAYVTNKYKYIKPETPVIQKNLPNKVLINPNFKQTVHINPNFRKNQPQNPPCQKEAVENVIQNSRVLINPKIINVNFFKRQTVSKPVLPESKVSPRKRRNSIRTKYKIIKSSVPIKQCTISPVKQINRFKLDNRVSKPKSSIKKSRRTVLLSVNDSIRTCLFKNKVWKKSPLKFVKPNVKVENVKNKRSLITLRGKKYTTGLNKKSLKIVNQGARNNTSTIKSEVRKKARSRKLSLSQRKMESFSNLRTSILRKTNVKTERSNFRKNNIPCPVYVRFGKCRRKDAGRCVFKHNPDQIALCKNFLQGACLDDNCLLSHKVSLEKMPTCKYFLEGCCVRSTCPYLHVKISPSADICKNFLEGFCKEGVKCNKRHQFLCPNFEKYKKCERLRCRYPHIDKNITNCKEKVTSTNIKLIKVTKSDEKVENQQEIIEHQRYYVNEQSTKMVSEKNNDESYKRVKLGNLPSFIPFE